MAKGVERARRGSMHRDKTIRSRYALEWRRFFVDQHGEEGGEGDDGLGAIVFMIVDLSGDPCLP